MNVLERIVEAIMERGNLTRSEAEHVSELYRDANVIRIDLHNGGWTVTHGVFMEHGQLRHVAKL